MVLNWETTGQMPSEAQGVADAKAAQAEAAGLGLGGAVIYFSADFDPTGQTAAINAYMSGVASVIGEERTGLYGGYAAIQAYFDAGIGAYGWQTYAWSSGEWDLRAQLEQWNNDDTMGPATVDQDGARSPGSLVKIRSPALASKTTVASTGSPVPVRPSRTPARPTVLGTDRADIYRAQQLGQNGLAALVVAPDLGDEHGPSAPSPSPPAGSPQPNKVSRTV